MASVYRVRHRELGTHFTLKLLHVTGDVVRDGFVSVHDVEGPGRIRLTRP